MREICIIVKYNLVASTVVGVNFGVFKRSGLHENIRYPIGYQGLPQSLFQDGGKPTKYGVLDSKFFRF